MITIIGSPIPAVFEAKQETATERADASFKFICEYIMEHGSWDKNPRPKWEDGTPAHAQSVNHVMQIFDLSKGDFPLLSLRPIAIKKSIGEILWIYKDQSNSLEKLAKKYGVTWWDEWDIGNRSIGQCYGKTVKDHKITDKVLKSLTEDPDSRRHIINLYQYDDFEQRHGLKPCALYSQYNVRHEKDGDYLDAFLLLRSSDYVVAGAINQSQYIALMEMFAQVCGLKLGVFTCELVNCQIYDRHQAKVLDMLSRYSIPGNPYIELSPDIKNFYEFGIKDFKIKDYPREEIMAENSQIKFDVAV
ncbi:thymidylate synthase [bacterium]|nr:thymidylate synthase [bacterium]